VTSGSEQNKAIRVGMVTCRDVSYVSMYAGINFEIGSVSSYNRTCSSSSNV